MMEKIPSELQLKVFLKIVRSLIKSSKNAEVFRLNQILAEEKKSEKVKTEETFKESLLSEGELKKRIRKEVRSKLKKPKEGISDLNFFEAKRPFPHGKIKRRVPLAKVPTPTLPPRRRRILTVPETRLPSHLSTIRPVALPSQQIDLGKLNKVLDDLNVSTIETEGENEPVFVVGTMGRKPTSIKLSKVEINEVINRFSKEAKIPVSEGIFRAAIGKLLLTAMVSETVSPRFVIEKIKTTPTPPSPAFQPRVR